MNQTNFEHAAYALLMMLFFGLLTGDWWVGAAFGAAFFVGIEHAQAEDKVRKEGWAKHPYFEVFLSSRYWSLDAMLDWIFPTVAVVIAASGISYLLSLT
jgi:hypothetical protein